MAAGAPPAPASRHARQSPWPVPQAPAGGVDHDGTIRTLGTFLVDGAANGGDASRGASLYCPTPQALTTAGEGGNRRLALTVPEALGAQRRWNCALPEVALPTTLGVPLPVPRERPRWLRVADVATLLTGRFPDALAGPEWAVGNDLCREEPRVGLSRHPDGRVAIEGMLYRAEFRRFHADVRIGAVVTGEPTVAPVAFLGGRGRSADVSRIPLAKWPPFNPPAPVPGRFAVALATPAFFRSGWHPAMPDGATMAAALTGPAVASQGWDVANRRPRAMRWLCPAGSVWWVDAATVPAAEAVIAWHGRPICDDRPHAGYGLAFVGRWDEGGS